MLAQWVAVGIGGFFGAIARFSLGMLINSLHGQKIPYGTLLCNITGSFLIGLIFICLVERFPVHINLQSLLIAGFLGAFTTFSSFALESIRLFTQGDHWHGIGYILMSVLSCLLATLAGIWLGQQL